ncbi:hypothetical protein SDC9_196055 [bioreactor metagenome]|uniref:Uncharacterized protein n=1 Tax=bioreactor metagenome TaxID=1076179 RepID=A0A645IAZ9_9ZZZZ
MSEICPHILFLLPGLVSYAQTRFTDEYLINNRDKKTICLPRNSGKERSTANYEYKLKDSGEIQKTDLAKTKLSHDGDRI